MLYTVVNGYLEPRREIQRFAPCFTVANHVLAPLSPSRRYHESERRATHKCVKGPKYMADRYDVDRDRDRDRERERSGGRDWDRGRDWSRETGRDFGEHRYAAEPGREEWDRDRERRSGDQG